MANPILIYCPVFLPEQSGYTHAFSGLISNLLQHGHTVHVLTPQLLAAGQQEPLQHAALTIFRYKPELHVWALGLFYEQYQLAQKITRLHAQYAYRVIWVETGDAPLVPGFLSKTLRRITVVRFHSTSDTEYLHLGLHKKYKLRRWFWQYFAGKRIFHVAATNAYHLQYACNQVLHHQPAKRFVVTNTINTERYTPALSNSRQWVMLGRMDAEGYKQKGFDVLVKSMPMVADALAQADVTLHLIGEGVCSQQLRDACKPYVNIRVRGSLPHQEVEQLLSASDVVLLPSRYEGISMFALEALACGNAVIFGNTGGLADMVNGNGILVEPGNVDALANAIIQLLQHKDIATLKQQSLQIAQTRFSTQVQYKQLISAIKEVEYGD